MSGIPHTKRFLEYWTADTEFRAAFDRNPAAAVEHARLNVDPENLAALIALDGIGRDTEEVREYRAFIRRKLRYRESILRDGAPVNPCVRLWRQRQIQRSLWELGPARSAGLVHAPLCFELSRGCTVGCWFCGVGAEPFGGNFLYTPENRQLWRETLEVFHEFLGPAAACGFCYWATDPLDNPDYEHFILDFHDLLGRLPQTTTAQPLRDVARTRALLDLSRRSGGAVERFSVLSTGQFRRIMEAFPPEELEMVELIPQFNSSASPKVNAGSARDRTFRLLDAGKPAPSPYRLEDGGTIACVSGFLVNMVERKARLISPCTASTRWPLGYMVFDEFDFADAHGLREQLRRSIAVHMRPALEPADPVRAHSWLGVETGADGVVVSGTYYRVSFRTLVETEILGGMLCTGTHSLGEIASRRFLERGIPHLWTHQEVAALFNHGVLAG